MNLPHEEDLGQKTSFSFAITLIVAITTSLYHVFNYMVNNAIEPSLFNVNCYLFSTGIIVLLLLAIYTYFRGISIEIESTEFKSNINSLSSVCLKLSFLSFPVFLLFFLPMYFGLSFENFKFFISVIGGGLIVFIGPVIEKLGYNETFKLHLKCKTKYLCLFTLLLLVFLYIIDKDVEKLSPRMFLVLITLEFIRFINTKEIIKFSDIYRRVSLILILLVIIITPFVSMAIISQSHIDMQIVEDVAGNDSRIYGSLNVFGRNKNISLSLEKIGTKEGIIEVENVTLEPVNNSISSGTIILSNYLNDGEYFISLNMSNQSPGYYKLSTDTGDSRKQASKVFFLE